MKRNKLVPLLHLTAVLGKTSPKGMGNKMKYYVVPCDENGKIISDFCPIVCTNRLEAYKEVDKLIASYNRFEIKFDHINVINS